MPDTKFDTNNLAKHVIESSLKRILEIGHRELANTPELRRHVQTGTFIGHVYQKLVRKIEENPDVTASQLEGLVAIMIRGVVVDKYRHYLHTQKFGEGCVRGDSVFREIGITDFAVDKNTQEEDWTEMYSWILSVVGDERDQEIVAQLSQGKNVKEVAETLGVNRRTVERRMSAIRERLGIALEAKAQEESDDAR